MIGLLASTMTGGFLTGKNCLKSAQKITAAYDDLGANYSHDKLLASLSFGFWKYLFLHAQYTAGGLNLMGTSKN